MATHSSILAWEISSHGQRKLQGDSPWHLTESDMTKRLNNNIQFIFYFFILFYLTLQYCIGFVTNLYFNSCCSVKIRLG